MSRVERIDKPNESDGSHQPRQSRHGRVPERRDERNNVGHTPTKAEGEEQDVDEALRRER